MTNKVVISVLEDDDFEALDEILVGKLVLNCGRTLEFTYSSDVQDCSGEQFLDELGTVLNDALLISTDLGLEITIDESVEDFAEELEEGLSDKMYQVYKDFIRKEKL